MTTSLVINKIIGKRLRSTREELGLTQSAIALALDKTKSSISNIENGIQSSQLIDLYKIAELFNKEISYFLPTQEEIQKTFYTSKVQENLSNEELNIIENLKEELLGESKNG